MTRPAPFSPFIVPFPCPSLVPFEGKDHREESNDEVCPGVSESTDSSLLTPGLDYTRLFISLSFREPSNVSLLVGYRFISTHERLVEGGDSRVEKGQGRERQTTATL